MVRNYKKKRVTEVIEEDINNAVLQVVNGLMRPSEAAKTYNIKRNTLHYRIKECKNLSKTNLGLTTKYTVAQVFNKDEELMLRDYLIKSSKMNYGLTYKQAKELAFQYAMKLCKCLSKWRENKQAGIEWLKGFMKRHQELSLRKPENTSLSRSTSLNQHNVNQFFDNYEKVLKKSNFTPDRIYNINETSIMTVVQAPHVIASRGAKQVGQCVSAKRGQLITMCGIGNAIGNFIPPVFIFPRARFHNTMIKGGPPGCIGYANSPTSGWMTGPLFLKVLEHIKKLVRCSKEDPVLLLMDSHESHCTLDAINYCCENGMVPPHCTHRMQPLDVAVNGFSTSGIYPFSRLAFCNDSFQSAEVTNRPLIETFSIATFDNSHQIPITPEGIVMQKQDCMIDYKDDEQKITSNALQSQHTITPELVRPYPKALPRKKTNKGRKSGKSKILSDTPEREEIKKSYLLRKKRLEKQETYKIRSSKSKLKKKIL
ncbi:uncharacterized protein LOC136089643 [Hydra vulgaris]|uniref:Uncharacterized protein LOC136089643 n=1 Tax=Hydra vulgaris TaxID=6087 RepID=A0ABM4DBN2_HYDVU